MRNGPARRPPWYARADTRLAIVVVALLVVAGGAAAVQQRGHTSGKGAVVAEPVEPAPLAVADGTVTFAIEPTPTANTPPTPTPTPVPTPTPMRVDLRPRRVGVGETMLVSVRAPDAASVSLTFRGATYNLLREDEVFWGVVGVHRDDSPGADMLALEARDAAGVVLERLTADYEVTPVERPIDYVVLTEDEASVLTPEAAQLEEQLRAQIFSRFDRARGWSTFFIRPTVGVITTEFAQGRSYNDGPVTSRHSGMDIAAAEGTPIVAAAPGRVDWVGEMPIRGLSVIVDHGAGVKTGYHHLQSIAVTVDDVVEAGAAIGAMGASGLATGPHLHWEVTVWGVNVEPMGWVLTDFTP